MQFRKKPVVIEAEQFHSQRLPLPFSKHGVVEFADGQFYIQTLEGPLTVSDDDWVIRGVKGEFYPCKPDIFAATYEPELMDHVCTERDNAMAELQQLSDLLSPYTRSGETIAETVSRVLTFRAAVTLTRDDVETIIDGAENFFKGPTEDPELDAIWDPYIDKLKALKALL